MLRDILEKLKIEYFGAVPVSLCHAGNERLYKSVPEGAYAVFMLFPYYVEKTKGLAKFAAVPDYHAFAKTVFGECEKYLTDKYPARFIRGFADHSPLAEADGACRAGLGIMGEHGLLINEKYASFVCIGEIICTLTADELHSEGIPLGDGKIRRCEGCSACRAACPALCCGTDSREGCVSALTQKKQPLREDETIMVHRVGYTWGCDRCTLACPHNAGAEETPIGYFRDGAITGDAYDAISRMDPDTFMRYPFSWRKKDVILRNFSIVNGVIND